MQADLLIDKGISKPHFTLAYQKIVSQILILLFKQYMQTESSIRLDGMSAMEQPLRPANAFEDVIVTFRFWQCKLCMVLH